MTAEDGPTFALTDDDFIINLTGETMALTSPQPAPGDSPGDPTPVGARPDDVPDVGVPIGDVIVTGERPDIDFYIVYDEFEISYDPHALPTDTQFGDTACPWREFYQDSAEATGIFASVLGTLKNSPFTLDPRDDRAIDKALFSLDSLEIMIQSQTLDYSTLHATTASCVEIILSEGTDHLAAFFGALVGGGAAAMLDGPVPVGELIGGIGGAAAVYIWGDELPYEEVADRVADLLLINVDVPTGRRCD